MSIRSKFIAAITNDHIQASFVSGLCIIILALAFKKVLHEKPPYLESAIPGFVFTVYETVKSKSQKRILTRPLLWNIAMLAITAIIILRRVYF